MDISPGVLTMNHDIMKCRQNALEIHTKWKSLSVPCDDVAQSLRGNAMETLIDSTPTLPLPETYAKTPNPSTMAS